MQVELLSDFASLFEKNLFSWLVTKRKYYVDEKLEEKKIVKTFTDQLIFLTTTQ